MLVPRNIHGMDFIWWRNFMASGTKVPPFPKLVWGAILLPA
jgi:hypothetical protein